MSDQGGPVLCCRDMGDGMECRQPLDATIHDPVEGARVVGGHAFLAPDARPNVDARTPEEIWPSAGPPPAVPGGGGESVRACLNALPLGQGVPHEAHAYTHRENDRPEVAYLCPGVWPVTDEDAAAVVARAWAIRPSRLAVDADGYVWRIFPDELPGGGDLWSMAPVDPNSGNSPVAEPVTYYAPAPAAGLDREAAEKALAKLLALHKPVPLWNWRGKHDKADDWRYRPPKDAPDAKPTRFLCTTCARRADLKGGRQCYAEHPCLTARRLAALAPLLTGGGRDGD